MWPHPKVSSLIVQTLVLSPGHMYIQAMLNGLGMLYIHVYIYMHMYIHVTKIKEVVMNWGPLEELEGTKEGEEMTWMKFSKILCHTHTQRKEESSGSPKYGSPAS